MVQALSTSVLNWWKSSGLFAQYLIDPERGLGSLVLTSLKGCNGKRLRTDSKQPLLRQNPGSYGYNCIQSYVSIQDKCISRNGNECKYKTYPCISLHQQELQWIWIQNISLHIIASAGMAMNVNTRHILAYHCISRNCNESEYKTYPCISLHQQEWPWIWIHDISLQISLHQQEWPWMWIQNISLIFFTQTAYVGYLIVETSTLFLTIKAKAESHLVGFGITFSWVVLYWIWLTSCEKHRDSSQPLPQRSIHAHYQLSDLGSGCDAFKWKFISDCFQANAASKSEWCNGNCFKLSNTTGLKEQLFHVPLQSWHPPIQSRNHEIKSNLELLTEAQISSWMKYKSSLCDDDCVD